MASEHAGTVIDPATWSLSGVWHVRIFSPSGEIHSPSAYLPSVSEHDHEDPWHEIDAWDWDEPAGTETVAERFVPVDSSAPVAATCGTHQSVPSRRPPASAVGRKSKA